MKRYIFGAGAHGRVVADVFQSQNLPIDGFLDDDQGLRGSLIAGYPVLGGSEILFDSFSTNTHQVIVALGNAQLRLHLTQKFSSLGFTLLNAIHRQAVISRSAHISTGICICAGAIVNSDASIGDAVIINTGATVDHDCLIEAGAHLSPGVHLAGRVYIGSLSFLSIGVSVAPRIRIGANTIIGAGSVVVKDIPPGVLAYGTPARVIRELTDSFDWRRLL
jgi:acetyltransferase EpsM